MNIPNILAGVILLLLGRKLFWLFVACIGFSVAYKYAGQFIGNQPQHILMAIAIFFGIIGGFMAVFFQQIAIGISGFTAGGYISLYLFQIAGFPQSQIILLASIAGGIIGAVLMVFIFDWALIILSSMSGASLIIQAVNINQGLYLPAYIGLIIIGCAIQAKIMDIEPETDERKRKRLG
ncbi:DUF4203 domain-containing protein [Desulfobacterales bacterium HSG17]|nr:DUF4203 domain-containing protein [Desulfobacterales bacterium HSG17]